MNTNPKAIRILCYGDSNTWGDTPNGRPRYAANVRWPGKLQGLLGDGFEIIEEGLCGRTTDMDDPKEEGRNGKTYLLPCLNTHKPINLFILMLGSNDLKERYDKNPDDIARSIDGLIKVVKKAGAGPRGKSPKILIISPPLVVRSILPVLGMKGAVEKSKKLGPKYNEVAKGNDCLFIDISKYVEPSRIDGSHLSGDSHRKIAEVLAQMIREQDL